MLKRLFSIFLLLLFLFNVGGYHIMLWYLRMNASEQLTARLDNSEYSEDETIEIRIPITLPYPGNTGEYQRVHGKFDFHGVRYQLVKQKLDGDSLIVVCIADQQDKRTVKVISDYAKLVNELPANSKNNLHKFAKTLHDFIAVEVADVSKYTRMSARQTHLTRPPSPTVSVCTGIPSPPPEA